MTGLVLNRRASSAVAIAIVLGAVTWSPAQTNQILQVGDRLRTLRRSPELKLRHGPAAIEAFAALQRSILERFAPLLRPGGRLAYITCSILAAENEEVARAFGAAHPELHEVESAWGRESLPAACREGARLRLDPVRTGTDGFFIALWQRVQSLHAAADDAR